MVLNAWLKGLANGDQRRPTGSGSALEALQIHIRPSLLNFEDNFTGTF